MGKLGDTNEIIGNDYDDELYTDGNYDEGDYYYEEEEETPPPRRKKSSGRKSRRRRSSGKQGKRANKDVLRRFGQSVLAVLVTILLIVIVIAVAFGKRIKESMENHEPISGKWFLSLLYPEKYSYGMDPANLKDYFQLFADEDVAIILQDERIAAHAKYFDNTVYFSIDTVRDLFTKRFYVNSDENLLLYSTSTQVIRNEIGSDTYTRDGESIHMDAPVSRYGKDGTLYIAADYVRLFANFSYSFHTSDDHINRVQVYNKWEDDRIANMKNDTQIRIRGGIKSEVLREMTKGEEVEVLETMETWSKIKTSDAFIGFVENTTLTEAQTRSGTPVTDAYQPGKDYNMTAPLEQATLGWHQIFEADDGSSMKELTALATGMNVISPTWYFLQDEEGNYKSIANKNYVAAAHEKGYQVWALVENMDADFDEYALFSSSEHRSTLIASLLAEAEEYGFDGINMDIELTDAKLSKTGSHYVQFLRELSIETHARGLVLSVDVPPPTESNKGFDLEELGYVTDYVILMAYDEHYAGSDAGSVSSVPYVEKALDDTMQKYHVPAEKIVCGIPFYTRLWRTEAGSVNSEAVSMSVARDWVSNRSITPQWLDDCCQYYAEYKDGTANYQIWLEDQESIRAKLSVIGERGIKNIAAWKLGLEADGSWDTIDNAL